MLQNPAAILDSNGIWAPKPDICLLFGIKTDFEIFTSNAKKKNQQQQQYYTENMIMKGSVDDQANLNQIVPDCIEPMSPEYPLPIHLVCSWCFN